MADGGALELLTHYRDMFEFVRPESLQDGTVRSSSVGPSSVGLNGVGLNSVGLSRFA